MRRFLLIPCTMGALLVLGGQALAGPEWCDDGSPPPNDFRLRPTGTGSLTAPTWWLRSTTGGELHLREGINTLTGGVARGMEEALEHARPYDDLPRTSK